MREADHRPVVVIPAHGAGTRLRDVTGGRRPKTLVEVGEEPILARLLRAALEVADARVVVCAGPDDGELPAFLADRGLLDAVELARCAPGGYLPDVLRIAGDLGDQLTVIDSDLVVPHADLRRFLDRATPAAADGEVLIFGVTATPPSTDPRSIRVTVGPHGRPALAPGPASEVPRSMGACHWRSSGIAAAREFLRTRAGSFHDFVEHLVGAGARMALVEFRAAVNVNTRAELDLAEQQVRAWRRDGVE